MAETDETLARPAPGHPRTAIEESHTSVMGPTCAPSDLPGVHGSEAIHTNRQGMTFRAGNPPPEYLKWYVGQGGITGTRSGTPFATHQPDEQRAPSDPPPVGWDPESTADLDIAGGAARLDRAEEEAHERRTDTRAKP